MAISPAVALQERNTRRMQQKQDLEALIDATLQNNFPDSGPCYISIASNVYPSTVDAVIADYQSETWAVALQTDYNGNRRLVFDSPLGM